MILLLLACPGPTDTGDKPADTDTGVLDTDTGGTGDPPWPHCPDASAYVGDTSWAGVVQVTGEALYCSTSNEGRTLEQELEAKTLFRVIEGAYAVPTEEGEVEIAFPVCTLRADEASQPKMDGAGTTYASPSDFGSTRYTYLDGTQPMVADDGTSWSLDHTIVMVGPAGETPDPLVLDGGEGDASTGADAVFTAYRAGDSVEDDAAVVFDSCLGTAWDENLHTVTFDGGDVALDLYISDETIVTGSAQLVHASGTLDGTAFEVDNFFQLIYRPDHHHYTRHFAVLFDTPIGDACGLRIEEVDAQQGTTTAVVSTAACDLSVIETRATTAEDWVVTEN